MSEANVFILINLGCEMIYVIDQRLTAQSVAFDKSVQVLKDVTNVLLDPKFLERLIAGRPQKSLITPEHTRIILNDMACCSLMRLDENSMSKLWDLITMIYKWQIFESKTPQHILDITFRHLDGIGKLYPDSRKIKLIDYTKNNILDLWNSYNESGQVMIFQTLKNWFDIFHVKLSILMRLGFQGSDGELFRQVKLDHIDFIGENIYSKNSGMISSQSVEELGSGTPKNLTNNKFDNFADQLNVGTIANHNEIVSKRTRNVLFSDLKLNIDVNKVHTDTPAAAKSNTRPDTNEFIQINNSRSTANSSWESLLANKRRNLKSVDEDLNSLLNLKLT